MSSFWQCKTDNTSSFKIWDVDFYLLFNVVDGWSITKDSTDIISSWWSEGDDQNWSIELNPWKIQLTVTTVNHLVWANDRNEQELILYQNDYPRKKESMLFCALDCTLRISVTISKWHNMCWLPNLNLSGTNGFDNEEQWLKVKVLEGGITAEYDPASSLFLSRRWC